MKLLEQLVTTPGIAGREHRMRELIRKQSKGLFPSMHEDAMGNLIGIRPGKGKNPKRVMIAAHMDQIGFMVRHIDAKGFIWVVPVGGFDPRNLFARVVTICPDPRDPSQDLTGVMNPGGRPIHLATEEEKKRIPEVSDFSIDVGLPGEEVAKRVKIGDMVVLQAALHQVGNTIVSQCLDNRIGCWIALRALELLAKSKQGHACEIHCVFTSQEEVGVRGALPGAYGVKPDYGIAVDATLCVDTPGVPEEARTTKQGAGAAIKCMDSMAIHDYDLVEEFETVAKRNKIKHQRCILLRGGTDSAGLQRAGAGVRAFTLCCPTRYIHTVAEMVHKDDLFATRDLLAAWLAQVK